MNYRSTRPDSTRTVSLTEAVRRGTAPDGGLYMPCSLPVIPPAFFNNIAEMSLKDVGYIVANQLYGDDIPSAVLKQIVSEAINFDTPLVKVSDNIYALELFHGPSHSYKDFGARFMANLLHKFCHQGEDITILVATSGDAGQAVAQAFHGMPNVKVAVLYPKGHTGDSQLRRILSAGDNIIPIEVRGSFADCLELTRLALGDNDMSAHRKLMAANSYNLARLLPQTIYYFYAYASLRSAGVETSNLVISVPTGNLGNLTAGLIAKKMGLPVRRFIISAQEPTDPLTTYLATGKLPRPLNDPLMPPNFARVLDLYGNSHTAAGAEISSAIYSPEEIIETIAGTPYRLEPNAAAAYRGLKESLRPGEQGIFLATTSPDKLNTIPESWQERRPISIAPTGHALKNVLSTL